MAALAVQGVLRKRADLIMKTGLKHCFSLHVCLYPPQLFVFLSVYPPAGAVHILSAS